MELKINDLKIDSQLRHAVEHNHLIDWLEVCKGSHEFISDEIDGEYDPSLELMRFIGMKKAAFCRRLEALWNEKLLKIKKRWANLATGNLSADEKYLQGPIGIIRHHAKWPPEKQNMPRPEESLEANIRIWHEQTLYAMHCGTPVICRPLLLDDKTDEKCPMLLLPSMMVRKDVLPRLVSQMDHVDLVRETFQMGEKKDSKDKVEYVIVVVRYALLKLKAYSIDPNPKSVDKEKDIDGVLRLPNITGLQLTTTADLIWYRALGQMYRSAFAKFGHDCRVYMMGRGYKTKTDRNNSAVGIAIGLDDGEQSRIISERLAQAHQWWLDVRSPEAKTWCVLPRPNNKWLWPNMKTTIGDGHWHNAKSHIADQLRELTKLWYVTFEMRVDCHSNYSVFHYDDPRLHVGMFNLKAGQKRTNTLDKIIKVNQKCSRITGTDEDPEKIESKSDDDESISPWTRSSSIVRAKAEERLHWPDIPTFFVGKWENPPRHWTDQIESKNFFGLGESKQQRKFHQYPVWVDFENTSSIDDDLGKFPMMTDMTRVPLFECSVFDYTKNKDVEKRFYARTARGLSSEVDEIDIFFEWFSFMEQMRLLSGFIPSPEDEKKYEGKLYIISHWSPAEPSLLNTSFNSVLKRLRGSSLDEKDSRREKLEKMMKQIEWFDVCKFMRDEGWVARGCLNYSLKSVAKTMHSMGLIDQIWPKNQISNGMCAMIALMNDARQQQEAENKIRKSAVWQQIKNNQIPDLSQSKNSSALCGYLSIDVKTLRAIERVAMQYM